VGRDALRRFSVQAQGKHVVVYPPGTRVCLCPITIVVIVNLQLKETFHNPCTVPPH
jgi:hypothetical protein